MSYFQQLLRTTNFNVTSCPKVIPEEMLQPILDDAQTELIRPITSEEIKKDMFSISGDKALRPDSYSLQFFKTSWSIVGRDGINVVLSYF